jgi:hypothetical protein
MTILEIAIVLLIFQWAYSDYREPARRRDRSRCNSR